MTDKGYKNASLLFNYVNSGTLLASCTVLPFACRRANFKVCNPTQHLGKRLLQHLGKRLLH